MPNNWFQFKQFRIEQAHCAMKVGTDGVILGAWTNTDHCSTVLDIGTGTGLLALMIAQRNRSTTIDGIEIDPDAARQAVQNVANSIFNDRIIIRHSSFQSYLLSENSGQYDLVLCNPPYFSASLKGINDQRNMARHDDQLSLETIIKGTKGLLSEKGRLNIIIPVQNRERLNELLADTGLFINRLLEVYPTPDKGVSRCCYEISAVKTATIKEKLVIETGKRHQYSDEYRSLTEPFYL